MTRSERLITALESLNEALGPAYTEEEKMISINLTHDRGMRLRRLLQADKSCFSRNLPPKTLDTKPTYEDIDYFHKLQLGDVNIKWKSRCIDLGPHGREYI